MERYDIMMMSSAWGRRYVDSIRGSWMPLLGIWTKSGGWNPSGEYLHTTGTNINPAPLIIVLYNRVRERDINVRVRYKVARLASWDREYYAGRWYDYPVYEHDKTETITVTIPAFSERYECFRINESENLIYDIVSVNVTSTRVERFGIYALASPTARIMYANNWSELYDNAFKVKRGHFSSLTVCETCEGTGEYNNHTCPECDGFLHSGTNATSWFLDQIGDDVGVSRQSGETESQFAKRVWARKWWIIPVKDEIERYFKFFFHVDDEDISIIEIKDLDEPTYFVAVDQTKIGSGALWQAGNPLENWDALVERSAPAGVNAYFAWLLSWDGDTLEENDPDENINMKAHDAYGSQMPSCFVNEVMFNEGIDSTSECSGVYKSWESFYGNDDYSQPAGWTQTHGLVEIVPSFLGHNKVARCYNEELVGDWCYYQRSIAGAANEYQIDFYICLCDYMENGDLCGIQMRNAAGGTHGFYMTNDAGTYKFTAYETGVNHYFHTGIDLMRWYHLHFEVNVSAGTAKCYMDGNYITTITFTNPIAIPEEVDMLVTSGGDCDLMLDAIDGSWDTGYAFFSNNSYCITRNMFQREYDFDGAALPGDLIDEVPSDSINHWINGFRHLTVNSYDWIPHLYGHEAVLKSPSMSVPMRPDRKLEYYHAEETNYEAFNYGDDTRPQGFTAAWESDEPAVKDANIYVRTDSERLRFHDYDKASTRYARTPVGDDMDKGIASFELEVDPDNAVDNDGTFSIELQNGSKNALATIELYYWHAAGDYGWRFRWRGGHTTNRLTSTTYRIQIRWEDHIFKILINEQEVGSGGFDEPGIVKHLMIQTDAANDLSGDVYIDNFRIGKFWKHRKILVDKRAIRIYDDHMFITQSQGTMSSYTINHDFVSGICYKTQEDFINTHGGLTRYSNHPEREMSPYFHVRGSRTGIVDRFEGMSLPYCIHSNNTSPQYIEDKRYFGTVSKSWKTFMYLNPSDHEIFKIQLFGNEDVAIELQFQRGNILNNAGNILGKFTREKWNYLKINYDNAGHTFDVFVDMQTIATGETYVNNHDPIVFGKYGWMEPASCSHGAVAYIKGISHNEYGAYIERTPQSLVRETVSLPEMVQLQGSLTERMERFSFYRESDANPAHYYRGLRRSNSSLLSVFSHRDIDGTLSMSNFNELTWVGGNVYSFPSLKDADLRRGLLNNRYHDDGDYPRGFAITEDSDTNIEIEETVGTHNKVIKFYDNNAAGSCNARRYFGETQEGYAEFYVRTTSATDSFYMDLIGNGVVAFRLYMDGATSTFRYHGGAFNNPLSFLGDTWYKVELYFDCDNDVATVRINNDFMKVAGFEIAFDNAVSNVSRIKFATDNGDSGYTCYVDALNFSWNPKYKMGDIDIQERLDLGMTSEGIVEFPLLKPRYVRPVYPGSNTWQDEDIGDNPIDVAVGFVAMDLYHGKCVRFDDTNGGYVYFDSTSSGTNVTVEWWERNQNAGGAPSTRITLRDGVTVVTRLFFNNGDVDADDGGVVVNMLNMPMDDERWFHCRMDLDFTAHTYMVRIDNEEFGPYNFVNNQNQITALQVNCFTDNSTTWIDAVGCSWDSGYNVGDNWQATRTTKWTYKTLDDISRYYNLPSFYKATYYNDWSAWTLNNAELAWDEDHAMCIKMEYDGSQPTMRLTQSFSEIGYMEFWVKVEGVSNATTSFELDIGGRFTLSLTNEILEYSVGLDVHDINGNTIGLRGSGWNHIAVSYNSSVINQWCQVYLNHELLWDFNDAGVDLSTSSGAISYIEFLGVDNNIDVTTYIDAVGVGTSYERDDNLFPFTEWKDESINLRRNQLDMDGLATRHEINKKDKVTLVSKGLNKLY